MSGGCIVRVQFATRSALARMETAVVVLFRAGVTEQVAGDRPPEQGETDRDKNTAQPRARGSVPHGEEYTRGTTRRGGHGGITRDGQSAISVPRSGECATRLDRDGSEGCASAVSRWRAV